MTMYPSPIISTYTNRGGVYNEWGGVYNEWGGSIMSGLPCTHHVYHKDHQMPHTWHSTHTPPPLV